VQPDPIRRGAFPSLVGDSSSKNAGWRLFLLGLKSLFGIRQKLFASRQLLPECRNGYCGTPE